MLGNDSMFPGQPTLYIYLDQLVICTNMMLTLNMYSWQVFIKRMLLVEEITMVIFKRRNV